MKCQCQILHVGGLHCSQHVTNAQVSACTSLPAVDFIRICQSSVFGHIPELTRTSSTQRPYIVKSACRPVVHLLGIGDVVLVVLMLAGQTNSAMTLDANL